MATLHRPLGYWSRMCYANYPQKIIHSFNLTNTFYYGIPYEKSSNDNKFVQAFEAQIGSDNSWSAQILFFVTKSWVANKARLKIINGELPGNGTLKKVWDHHNFFGMAAMPFPCNGILLIQGNLRI